MAAASCDGSDGENNVDSFLVGGVGGASACHCGVYCRTVHHPLVHRYEQVKKPTCHGIGTKQTDGGRPLIGHDQWHLSRRYFGTGTVSACLKSEVSLNQSTQ